MLDGSSYDDEDLRSSVGLGRADDAEPVHEGRIKLHDGRMLGYAEYGSRSGQPVFYCHGFPASRFEAALANRAAQDVNVRLLSFDRPGYGLSDHKPGRTLLDWAQDMECVADRLGIKRFAILGVSGGAPYALACAYAIPHRLTAAGVVCGLGPTVEPELRRAMMWTLRTGLFLGRHFPTLLSVLYAGLISPLPRWQPKGVAWLLNLYHSGADRVSMRHPALKETLVASVHEAFRRGSTAAVHDIRLYARPWGFDPEAITAPVYLWHGEADPTVPVSMGRYLAARLQRCRARFFPNEGHFSLPVNYAAEILATLAGSGA